MVLNKCGDCIHADICKQLNGGWFSSENVAYCKGFKDRANFVEVVHGRWKYYHKQNKAVCTNCSFERDLDANFGKAVSCPNCGAKMGGDGNG